MSIDSLANKSVIVQRSAVGVSDAGAYEETFETWKTWQVRIQPLTATGLEKLGREGTDIGIKIYGVPIGVQEPDRIIYDGRTFEILGVRDIDELGRLSTVDCVEIL